jgi:hypothetical protein
LLTEWINRCVEDGLSVLIDLRHHRGDTSGEKGKMKEIEKE